MRRLCTLISCFLPLLIILSCKRENIIEYKTVENVTFYALPKGIERVSSLVSFQQLKMEGRDSTISNRKFIREFIGMINRLRPEYKEISIDIRSAAVIATGTGDTLIIAFGENHGTAILNDKGKDKWDYHEDTDMFLPSMTVNGTLMQDYPPLFDYIDKNVYATHPHDYWFNDETRRLLGIFRTMIESGE